MAECEVCGDVIRGKPILVSIDGTKMSVCQKCSKLGVPVETPGSELRNQPAGKIRTVPAGRTVQAAPKKRTRDVYDMMEGELVEDFGERIRAARVAKGLSQKDLALELKEKEGLIKKIEAGLIPEDAVRKKIETFLEISLIDAMETTEKADKSGSITPTLGDVMKIKKTK